MRVPGSLLLSQTESRWSRDLYSSCNCILQVGPNVRALMTHLLLSNCVIKKVRSFILCEFVKQNKSINLSPQLEEGNGVGDFKEPLQGTDEGNVSAFKKNSNFWTLQTRA